MSYADGTALIPTPGNWDYYLQAQAIQPPPPILMRKEASIVQLRTNPKTPAATQTIPAADNADQGITKQDAATSSASRTTPSLFGWIKGVFAEGPAYSVDAIGNFALAMVGLQLLRNVLSGFTPSSDELENDVVETVPEDQIEQTIANTEAYLKDCEMKLTKYKQLSILHPEQVSEIGDLLWAIKEHRITLDEIKGGKNLEIVAQQLGEVRADIECLKTEFIALENEIRGECNSVKVVRPAENRCGFFYHAVESTCTQEGKPMLESTHFYGCSPRLHPQSLCP